MFSEAKLPLERPLLPNFMNKTSLIGNKLFLIDDFLSAQECEQFIAQSEASGYEEATITGAGGASVLSSEIRNNERLILDDEELAARFYARAQPLLASNWLGWEVLAFNERFRFYRYDVGQTFNRHFDGAFSRNDDEQSQFTFLIYLNDDFAGGHTNFFDDNGAITHSVQPRRGMALVFWHPMMHEGATVTKGRKYVLRTDVMYRWE